MGNVLTQHDKKQKNKQKWKSHCRLIIMIRLNSLWFSNKYKDQLHHITLPFLVALQASPVWPMRFRISVLIAVHSIRIWVIYMAIGERNYHVNMACIACYTVLSRGGAKWSYFQLATQQFNRIQTARARWFLLVTFYWLFQFFPFLHHFASFSCAFPASNF